MLLTYVGDTAYEVYENLKPKEENSALSFKETIEIFGKHFKPQTNKSYETFIFRNIKQQEGETSHEFYIRLKEQSAKSVNFYKTFLDSTDISSPAKVWNRVRINLMLLKTVRNQKIRRLYEVFLVWRITWKRLLPTIAASHIRYVPGDWVLVHQPKINKLTPYYNPIPRNWIVVVGGI